MTPGNRPDRITKATSLPCDSLVIDLEDSIPPAEKSAARQITCDTIQTLRRNHQEICVRINGLDTPYGLDDLSALPLSMIDSLMIPKVESSHSLLLLEERLNSLHADRDQQHPLQLIVMLETPRGILNALSISDTLPRTKALFFGSGDYCSARSVVTAAAAACNIQAIDAAFFERVKDAEATQADAIIAREFGFCGKVVFHPNQIDVVNKIFSPIAEEIEAAEKLILGYQESIKKGFGTAVVDGTFVAVDLIGPAQRTLDLARHLKITK
jgi:citrate lyase subunit beta/citryl-CoA lyase